MKKEIASEFESKRKKSAKRLFSIMGINHQPTTPISVLRSQFFYPNRKVSRKVNERNTPADLTLVGVCTLVCVGRELHMNRANGSVMALDRRVC